MIITVIAKCPHCKKKKTYSSDKPLSGPPFCDTCFLVPMIIDKVTTKNK